MQEQDKRIQEWTELDKAMWVLENSWTPSKMVKLYTRVNDWVYSKPGGIVPPWIPRGRQLEYQIGG